MMTITILGWYGTETLGDRAILDGICIALGEAYGNCKIYLASLFPFFTERTLMEDFTFYQDNSRVSLSFTIVDERDNYKLRQAIKKSDLVCVGGGPLMDLDELSLLSNAFIYAKLKQKATIILGCGLGPIKEKYHIKEVENLFRFSDYIIFRDSLSLKLAIQMFAIKKNYVCFGDPAIISVLCYLNTRRSDEPRKEYCACNFRRYSSIEYGNIERDVSNKLLEILQWASEHSKTVILAPMHTFSIGGDDREYLFEILRISKLDNVILADSPLALREIYKLYFEASFCIGMRYHSIVMQSILNANNYIVDYTDKKKGKIRGFLERYGLMNYYKTRYINLAECSDKSFSNDMYVIENYQRNNSLEKFQNVYDSYVSFFKSISKGIG